MKQLFLLFSIFFTISASAITYSEAFKWAKKLGTPNERAARIARMAQRGQLDLNIYERALEASAIMGRVVLGGSAFAGTSFLTPDGKAFIGTNKDFDLAETFALNQNMVGIEAFEKVKKLGATNTMAVRIANAAQKCMFDYNVFKSVLETSGPRDHNLAESLATQVSNSSCDCDSELEHSVNDSSRRDTNKPGPVPDERDTTTIKSHRSLQV